MTGHLEWRSEVLAYYAYEGAHMMLSPARAISDATHLFFKNPANPLTYTPFGRFVTASCELFERTTRRYGKPVFGLPTTLVEGERLPIVERIVWEKPFCKLIHFEKQWGARSRHQPRVLIVAPMSGHYATLLRGTVETFLPTHDVYITDWVDARLVPLTEGFSIWMTMSIMSSTCSAISGRARIAWRFASPPFRSLPLSRAWRPRMTRMRRAP